MKIFYTKIFIMKTFIHENFQIYGISEREMEEASGKGLLLAVPSPPLLEMLAPATLFASSVGACTAPLVVL